MNADTKKAEILDLMMDDQRRTVSEIKKAVPSMRDFSNQKAGSLVRQLYENNKLDRIEERGRALYVYKTDWL